ncbi:ATP-binding protein [uncultured Methylobacterium sp.]|uniref:ATP-binding protein n=1 Tax=uncultured Methylobacterium sp. TaxID=157278 RepID=UPI00262D0D42|nr:ATP-binding protein [uncultured Methylobacterium sp.]
MRLARRNLFWKIYLTLLASLFGVAFAMGSLWWALGESPRQRWETLQARLAPQIEALGRAPDGAGAEGEVQKIGDALGADLALYDESGGLIAARGRRAVLLGRDRPGPSMHWVMRVSLAQGRTLLASFPPPRRNRIAGIAVLALLVAAGIGLAAFPVTARLTRQLERLRAGVARWGDGDLGARMDERGNDEVAAVARTFNLAAARVDGLLASQRTLLANASHELRSPLARLRLAIDLWDGDPAGPARREILRNLAELDALVEEILLSSRLDHARSAPRPGLDRTGSVDLLGLAAEEAARTGAEIEGEAVSVTGDEVLLRRLLRNLIENGATHGRPPVRVAVAPDGASAVVVVADAGPGIAPAERERVFEPFYRPRGRDEAAGGWGLGLALVRQIAERHGGAAACEAGADGGSRFVVRLPREA